MRTMLRRVAVAGVVGGLSWAAPAGACVLVDPAPPVESPVAPAGVAGAAGELHAGALVLLGLVALSATREQVARAVPSHRG